MERSIADQIERYLKELLERSEQGVIELRRQYVAEIFACVPSQINYVLSTRFTDSHGYIVETRRGGGGFIKIAKIDICPTKLTSLINKIGAQIDQQNTEAYISRFLEDGLITRREADLIKAATHRDNLVMDLPGRDQIRANILKAMLMEVYRFKNKQE